VAIRRAQRRFPAPFCRASAPAVAATITAKGIQLRNAWTLATISPRGELVEFVDISHPSRCGPVREASCAQAAPDRPCRADAAGAAALPRPRNLLPAGATANRLMVYEDIPLFWDAWDVELYHREKPVPLAAQPIVQAATVRCHCSPRWRRPRHLVDASLPALPWRAGCLQITENGPLRVAVTLAVRVGDSGKSTLTQTISLDVASPTLRFRTRVDWHENRRILKAEFPLDVLTDRALFETQFGTVTRPTHSNTSWDAGSGRWERACEPWRLASLRRYRMRPTRCVLALQQNLKFAPTASPPCASTTTAWRC